MLVPFVDLELAHRSVRAAIASALDAVVNSSQFVNGPAVARFEEAFAAFAGARHCVGVASGLDALRLALIALELERGDEVVVPAHTFIATVEAISQAGAAPVLADISEADYCLDPEAAAAAVNGHTRVVLPVHLYGQMADMAALQPIAARHGLEIVEDACQAHGAERDGLVPGAGGTRCGLQLLSGQEPRSLRRRGSRHDAGRRPRRARPRTARARAGREVRPPVRGVDGAPRHDPGGGARAEAPSAGDRGTTSGARPQRPISLCSTASATCGCRTRLRGAARSGISSSFAPLGPMRWRRTSASAASRRDATTRTHPPDGGVRPPRASGRRVPGRRATRARGPVPPVVPRDHRLPAGARGRLDPGLLRWLTARSTTPLTA